MVRDKWAFDYDTTWARHVRDNAMAEDDELLDAESPWEAAFEEGERLARETSTVAEVDWDED